jgi:peptidoglycan/xylan/chitin deacetylase (PgdA/CDA1 family)
MLVVAFGDCNMDGVNKLSSKRKVYLPYFYYLLKNKIKKEFGLITNVETNKPLVAMTFDDGPDPVYTPMLLKAFKEFKAQGTFFMVGNGALKYKSIVYEAAKDGHDIGNHTMDHISMLSVGRRERWKQIIMCKKALFPYGQGYFRPPYGEQNGWSNIDAAILGYQPIGWNIDVDDWRNGDLISMAEEIRQKITNGCIILFHDTIYDQGNPRHKKVDQPAYLKRDATVKLVELLLREFRGRFQFVTISEMLKNGKAQREK